jgi:hypothetical protein
VIIDPQLNLAAWDHGASWRPSFEAGGSPGERDMMLGDFDNDMDVDLSDLMFLQQHLGMNGATKALGDLTDDGTVDRRDLARFVASFGRSYVAPAAPAASAGAAVSAGAVVAQAKAMPASRKLRRASVEIATTDHVLAAFSARDIIRSSRPHSHRAVQR